ncbi:MAG TPA: DCC1-like thiol-disulfide oxidoreductase family protein [Thermoleophilaceae bacterium]|jgi:predicted DCC family thiol-disulfide oxidoreductase YuxK
MPDRAIVLYDRDCGFCRWTLSKLLAWDRRRRLDPVPIESAEGARLLASVPEDERPRSWHLVADGGEVRSAGAALAPMLRLLPGGAPLAAVAAALPRASEMAYRLVADRRSVLGRLVTRGAAARAARRVDARSAASPRPPRHIRSA